MIPLAYAKQLIHAGVPAQQAEAQAEALFASLKETIVTQSELAHEMDRVGRRIDQLEEKMDHRFKEVDHQFKEMDSKFTLKNAELKNDLIKWVIGISATQTALISLS